MQSGNKTNDPLKSGPAKAGTLTRVATTPLLYNTTMFFTKPAHTAAMHVDKKESCSQTIPVW